MRKTVDRQDLESIGVVQGPAKVALGYLGVGNFDPVVGS